MTRRGDGQMRAGWNGAVIAESDDTVVLEGNHYFPLDAVRGGALADSESRTLCPWKGFARYKTVTVDGMSLPDGAWYYPRPSLLARSVKGRVAFWRGVAIEAAPSPGAGDVTTGVDG
jgi:uncharacterized protein (DUF427 family)